MVAGKSGTSSELRDSWFAGFSGSHLAVVWVGYDDNRPTEFTGSSGALQVWSRLMAGLNTSSRSAPLPENLAQIDVEYPTGLRASRRCARGRGHGRGAARAASRRSSRAVRTNGQIDRRARRRVAARHDPAMSPYIMWAMSARLRSAIRAASADRCDGRVFSHRLPVADGAAGLSAAPNRAIAAGHAATGARHAAAADSGASPARSGSVAAPEAISSRARHRPRS